MMTMMIMIEKKWLASSLGSNGDDDAASKALASCLCVCHRLGKQSLTQRVINAKGRLSRRSRIEQKFALHWSVCQP